jgi:ribosome maturation factor RimP
VGELVRLQLSRALDGRRRFKARIKAVEGADIVIEDEGEVFTIPFSLVDKARLVPEFDH